MLNQSSRQNLSACEYLDINQSKDSKASEARKKQHKILLFKLNKHSHPHYLLQKSQTCEIKDQQNLERTAYTVKSESHQKMHSKFKPKEKTKRLNIKQTSKMKKQNSQMLDEKPKLSMTQSVGSKWREQHREQKSHFMKMILFIDRKDKRCSLKQSVQNLIILGSSITKVKILIYKHYKAIIVHKEQHQMNNIKYYCLRLFSHFKELIGLIENNVDKNQNYKKYVRSLKKFEPSISKQTNSFEQHLQCLLFYFSSVIELKRFYEVCANSDQFIGKILPEDISSITNHIVRIRHYLGYLAKFIVNPLMQNSPAVNKKSVAGQDNKDIWKYIYQKKYTAKVGKYMSK